VPIPIDEYPVHQVPLSIEHCASSDRNFYDRCYLNAHDRTGEIMLITGLGVYPNLGVIDAYGCVRIGDRQISVRTSDALGPDRLRQEVGPYRVEIIEPLQKLRVVLDGDDHGLGFDLTWTGSFPAVEESPHLLRQGGRVILDACRFAQVGTWTGEIRAEGESFTVSDDTWLGTRDRSWGIRGNGEPEPPGRLAAEPDPEFGFWWMYIPMRFDDFGLIFIAQEDAFGHRTLNDAIRVWPAASGKGVENLGFPEYEVRYRSGTRLPESCRITVADLEIEVESLGYVVLHAGCGYGGDPAWRHGMWKGRGWVEGGVADLNDPAVSGLLPFGVIDHVGKATVGGQVGWGLFEHGMIGRYDPSGFADYFSVAP
jgi:hypothetical protein